MDSLVSSDSHLCLAISVGVIAYGFYYYKTHSRRMKAWEDFASQHGWKYSTGNLEFKVEGLHRGLPFAMYTEWRRSGNSSNIYTVVKLSLAGAVPSSLRISREAVGDKLRKLFGKRDDEIGDEEMDDALDLRNLDEEARDILRAPRVREKLLLLRQRSPYFSIENEELKVSRGGMLKNLEALESLVVPALELSDALHDAAKQVRQRRSG
jgi:hypothetical protein